MIKKTTHKASFIFFWDDSLGPHEEEIDYTIQAVTDTNWGADADGNRGVTASYWDEDTLEIDLPPHLESHVDDMYAQCEEAYLNLKG